MATGYVVVVKDYNGEPLTGVPVVPVDGATGAEGTPVSTDAFGLATFTGLADSNYGFRTHLKRVGDCTFFVVSTTHAHGAADHGTLTGLGDDDHPQYETSAEAAAKITAHEAAGNPHSVYATDTDLSTHAALATHHTQAHVLATGTALGPDHTMSGATAGDVLRALSATTAAFDVLAHSELSGLSGDDHPLYQSAADVAADIAAHSALPNPHAVYHTSAEVAFDIAGHAAIADAHHTENHGPAAHANRTRYLWLPPRVFGANVGAPAITFHGNSGSSVNYPEAWAFRATATDSIVTSFLMPADWDLGAVTVIYWWSKSAAGANDVRWEWVWVRATTGDQADVGGAAVSLTVTPPGTAENLATTTIGTFTPAGAKWIRASVRRLVTHANDTYASNIWLYGVELQYEADG